MLDGHVEVPHLTDAEEDRYSSLFKDVGVGTAWRGCVISKMQGPIYPGGLSVCKSELGLGRDVLIGDDVLHGFDGLSKTLDCMPAAHGSGTSVVQDRIGRIVLRDDRRHQLLLPKGCDLLRRTNCVLKLHLIGSASRGWPLSHDAHMRHGMPLALVLCWMSHGISTSLVHSMSMIDPNLGLSNRHR